MGRRGELQLQEQRTMEFKTTKLMDGVKKETNLLTLLMVRLLRHPEPLLPPLQRELLLLLAFNDKLILLR